MGCFCGAYNYELGIVMGIEPKQLKRLIMDVLHGVDCHSNEAVDLLMLTAAQESEMGRYLYQLGNGPARGIFQHEPATRRDLFENFLKYRPNLLEKATSFTGLRDFTEHVDLVGNIPYQIVVARFQYLRFPERLPWRNDFDDEFDYVSALAGYWKKYWNTYKGKGHAREAVQNYYRYVVKG